MTDKSTAKEPQVKGKREGYGGKAAGYIAIGVIGFIGYLVWERHKTTTATPNVATTSGMTTPLNIASPSSPTTAIPNATASTEVYPISVTDSNPGALSLADFQYGASPNPQFTGQAGIPYSQYVGLVG